MDSRAGISALAVALALTGCGGSSGGGTVTQPAASSPAPQASQAPASSPTSAASAAPAPDEGDPALSSDGPIPMSRGAAAARYLELAESANAAGERLDTAITARDLKKIRSAAKQYVTASRALARGLQETPWPYDVEEYTEWLSDSTQDDQRTARDIAAAKSVQEAVGLYSFGDTRGRKAAERIRQRLGLPAVGS